jgi:hypothetical protein
VRTKLIITGAIGVLAAATLTVNAQTSTQKTTPGSVARLLAASAQIVAADRDDITIATHAAASAAAAAQSVKPEAAESEKAEPAGSAASKLTLSASCQAAITAFRSLRQSEATEDAKERAAAEAGNQAPTTSDRSEDATEGQQFMAAMTAVRTACVPQVPTACRTALSGLLPLLQSLRNEELTESRTGSDAFSDGAALRAGFASVAATCLPSE